MLRTTLGRNSLLHPTGPICLVVLSLAAAAFRVPAAIGAPPADKPPEREIFVPFANLPLILSADAERVFMSREEYDALAAKAQRAARPEGAKQPAAVLSADYEATVEDNRARLLGTLTVSAPDDELSAVDLDISGVALRRATLDDQPAALGRSALAHPILFVSGAGQHVLKLEMIAPLEAAAAQRTLTFQIPTPPASRFRLSVSGDVNIKNHATVIERTVDEKLQVTQFDVLIRAGQNRLVLSLNHRQLQKDRVVVAHAVLIDEITTAYERLHATVSLSVLHGAADQFRFLVPDGFEVTSVDGPQVSRWAVASEKGRTILEVWLNEPSTESVSLKIQAVRAAANLEAWQLPKLIAEDVAGQATVVGLLLENRLTPYDLRPKNLLAIDADVLTQAIPAGSLQSRDGALSVVPVAAYYAPLADFALEGRFTAPADELRVTTNVLLTLGETAVEARGGFALLSANDKLFGFDFLAPAGWQVTEVVPQGSAALVLEVYPVPEAGTRVHVRLPQPVPRGQSQTVHFRAIRTEQGWLDGWRTKSLAFPTFQVVGATRDVGAIAVQAHDDIVARTDQVDRLTPLDANEKSKYGLEDVPTEMAFRYDAPPYKLAFDVSRVEPRLTARVFSFFGVQPGLLTAHYEIAYDVSEARTGELKFELPEHTPGELAIRGLDGVGIKESSSAVIDGARVWTVLLAERRRGAVRLAIDFQLPLSVLDEERGAPVKLTLPLARALDVSYQSGTVAVEGNAELDVSVNTALRKVDVGELAEADYQPGRRLLGAFFYGGDTAEVSLAVSRPGGYELPAAIVERAELLTVVSASGRSQTAARFQLRAKPLLVEVRLPEGSTLWSAYLDCNPTLSQHEGDSLLITLPPAAEARRRDLQFVYETPIGALGLSSSLDLSAPKLFVRTVGGKTGDELPLADVVWQLSTPAGYQVVRSTGTVFTNDIALRESPLRVASRAVFGNVSAVREAGRRAPKTASQLPAGNVHDAFDDFEKTVQPEAKTDEKPAAAPAPAIPPPSPETNGEMLGAAAEPSTEALGLDMPPAGLNGPGAMPAEKAAQAGKQLTWALEGLRSLPIELQADQIQTTFQSLGESPRLSVTVVDRRRFNLLAWAAGLLIFVWGVSWTRRSRAQRLQFVAVVLIAALALPLVLPWSDSWAPVCDMAFFAGCWLVVYYLAAELLLWLRGLARRVAGRPREVQVATALLASLSLAAGQVRAADPPPAAIPHAPAPITRPPAAITVPSDAIIVPYDPAKEDPLEALENPAKGEAGLPLFGAGKSRKILVPYAKYLELRRAADPEKKPRATPADYALAGAEFTARLDDGESLVVEGHLDVDVLVDRTVSVPLVLTGGVLTRAKVEGSEQNAVIGSEPLAPGAAAKGEAQQATAAAAEPVPLLLLVSGPGRRRIELAVRFRQARRGGWQVVDGRLPVAPAAALTFEVPKAGTEVTLLSGVDQVTFEAKQDHETIATALLADGAFHVQWRAKAGPAPVDQSLTTRGSALLDVQEDGLRLNWKFDLEFRRGQRESFTVLVPDEYLVEQVTGGNVRGWRLSDGEHDRKLDVTLLKAAQDSESFNVTLSRRGAVGSGDLTEIAAPVLNIAGAAQQTGQITIRRSPLLELRTEQTAGVSRIDSDTGSNNAGSAGEESPLGILPYQSYRFATTPFTIKLSAKPLKPRARAELETVLKISERQRTLESRIRLHVQQRPIYQLRVAIPADWKLDRVSAPEPFQWVVSQEDKRRLLNLYFAAGQRQTFELVLSGTLGEYGPAPTVALPKLEVIDASEQTDSIEQTGEIVVQADPSLDVRAEGLANCETALLARVNRWLAPAQQGLARLAIHYRAADYAGQIRLSPRKPSVHCDVVSNIRVTQRTVEETILLEFSIHEAGIRSLSFLLPASMRDARISAPMLRQKTIEPVDQQPGARLRVRLDLQDEVMNNLRVLVENDRLVTGEQYAAPIPEVETGQTDHRYVTLESAGRDEIVVDKHDNVDPLSQEQSEWRMLVSMLGRGLTQAYLVRPDAPQPLLTLRAQDRARVETAGARIGLAKATLLLDANGAYRGAQLFRVDNSVEQYLEIQLPPGAKLWTAHVAGEAVKPAASPTPGAVRIPLVKTAPGDADYPVILKYGGELGRLGLVDRVDFPLIHTLNVHVELSQVELHVPESYDWFNFGGTMRLVDDQGDLAAGWLSYNTKQIGRALEALKSDDEYAKARAINNLKTLQAESENLKQSAQAYGANPQLAQQLKSNEQIQLGLKVEQPTIVQEEESDELLDNRERLNERFRSQTNSFSGQAIDQAGGNFEPAAQQADSAVKPQTDDQTKSLQWLQRNKLGSLDTDNSGPAKQPPAQKPGTPEPAKTPNQPAAPSAYEPGEAGYAAPQLQGQKSLAKKSKDQINRYQRRLADQQKEQSQQKELQTLDPLQNFDHQPNASELRDQSGSMGGGMGGAKQQGDEGGVAPTDAPTGSEMDPFASPPATARPAESQSKLAEEAGTMASLDVDLHPSGTTYFFTTPRGDVEVTARTVAAPLVGRLIRLAVLAIGLLLVTTAVRRTRRRVIR